MGRTRLPPVAPGLPQHLTLAAGLPRGAQAGQVWPGSVCARQSARNLMEVAHAMAGQMSPRRGSPGTTGISRAERGPPPVLVV